MFFQPFGGDFSVRMIVQGAVYAGDGLYILEYGADVVADQHDGAFTVDVFQQGIEFGFEPLVDVCIGFIQDNQLRARYDGPSQQSPLELSAAQLTDGPLFQPFQSHTGNGSFYLPVLFGGESAEQ